MAGCVVEFADADFGDGWEGEVSDVACVVTVAGAVVGTACW